MGIETAALVVAAVGAATTVYSTVEANRAGKKAAGAQKEAADVAAAQQKQADAEARRKQIREQRIRAAQIEQGASNQGVSGSSGELGSLSALATNSASNLAVMSGNQRAAEGIGASNQRALNAQSDAQQAQALGGIASTVTSLAAPAAGKGLSNLFSGSTGVGNQVDTMIKTNPDIF